MQTVKDRRSKHNVGWQVEITIMWIPVDRIISSWHGCKTSMTPCKLATYIVFQRGIVSCDWNLIGSCIAYMIQVKMAIIRIPANRIVSSWHDCKTSIEPRKLATYTVFQ